MKVLQINCVYPNGSTGKIVESLHHYLSNKEQVSVVCYGRGKNVKQENIFRVNNDFFGKINNVYSRFIGIKYGGCIIGTEKLKRRILIEKPDVVHLHCINGYFVNIYKFIDWLKRNKIKTILTLHAEFMFTANCDHAFDCEQWKIECADCSRYKNATNSFFFDNTLKSFRLMKRAFEGFDSLYVVSVSPWLENRAKSSAILNKMNHCCILNGINTSIFCYKNVKKQDFNKALNGKIGENRIILHVTPCFSDTDDEIKGGKWLIQLANHMKNNNIVFLVAGSYKIRNKVPDNIILLGNIRNQDYLANLYSLSDLTLLLSKRETFSMVTIESLCCGTPVIGFKAGGPECIADPRYSSFVDYGNISLLAKQIMHIMDRKYDKEMISKVEKEKYSEEIMCRNYYTLYRDVYENYD